MSVPTILFVVSIYAVSRQYFILGEFSGGLRAYYYVKAGIDLLVYITLRRTFLILEPL